METSQIETTAPHWKLLYRFGAVAALLMIGIIVVQLIIFMTTPPPLEGSAMDWFLLFQHNRFMGLIDFELLMLIYTILSIPIMLSLYHALKQTDEAFTALAVVLSIIGVVCFIAARPVFEMLWLSDQFTSATTDAQRSIILAAGEANLASFHGTAFHVSYVLGSITGLIISLVMLKSSMFSKATAYVRIASSVFDFGLYIPTIGVFLSILSVLFLFVWNIMIARRLFALAQTASVASLAKNPVNAKTAI
jgi:hypothetical protein